jgi:hypothetical protein
MVVFLKPGWGPGFFLVTLTVFGALGAFVFVASGLFGFRSYTPRGMVVPLSVEQ